MNVQLEFTDDKFDLVTTTAAGNVHRFTLYQTVTRQLAEAVAAEPRLLRLLHVLEAEPICAAGRCTNASPDVVATVAIGLQLLQESVVQQTYGVAPVFADDEYTRTLAHEGNFADAVDALGSESSGSRTDGRSAIHIQMDGQRPVDLLATAGCTGR